VSRCAISFAAVLTGDRPAAVRAAVVSVADRVGLTSLHVDTVLGAFVRLERRETLPEASAYLLFDFHRLVCYEPGAPHRAAGIASVVRGLVDGYAFQPVDLLLSRAEEPFAFLYSPEILEVLETVWPMHKPEGLLVCDLATAEVTVATATTHPETVPRRRITGSRMAEAPPPAKLRLQDRWTDGSLRPPGKPALENLVSPAGPIRPGGERIDDTWLPLATAQIAWNRGMQKQHSYGKGLRPGESAFVARCEALERHHVLLHPPGELLIHGSYRELAEHAIDPRELFFPDPVRATQLPFHWTWAHPVLAGGPRLVPAQEIWFNTGALPGEHEFFRSTTNACALGGTLEDACLFALFEAIERDAYLTTWYLRRPVVPLDLDSVDHEDFQLLRRRWAVAFPAYEFHIFDIGTDLGIPAVAGIAVRKSGSGPRSYHSAAARLSVGAACFSALRDLTGFTPHLTAQRRKELKRLVEHPEEVEMPDGHFGLYAMDETFERLAFYDASPERTRVQAAEVQENSLFPTEPRRWNLREVLEKMAERASASGAGVYLKDITHPNLAERGICCAKAITPGLFPLWFGYGRQRFAVTERLKRLAREHCGREIAGPDDCNLELHPFS
jgi:thiazole/oxazole-forming peptide maturase SagD family component